MVAQPSAARAFLGHILYHWLVENMGSLFETISGETSTTCGTGGLGITLLDVFHIASKKPKNKTISSAHPLTGTLEGVIGTSA